MFLRFSYKIVEMIIVDHLKKVKIRLERASTELNFASNNRHPHVPLSDVIAL